MACCMYFSPFYTGIIHAIIGICAFDETESSIVLLLSMVVPLRYLCSYVLGTRSTTTISGGLFSRGTEYSVPNPADKTQVP